MELYPYYGFILSLRGIAMKKRLGIFAAVLLLTGFALSGCGAAQPGFPENSSDSTIAADTSTKLPLLEQSGYRGTVVITDKKQIAEIAKQQVINEPKEILQITFDFRYFSTFRKSSQTGNHANAASLEQAAPSADVIYNVKDLGCGFSNWDDCGSDIFDGPAETVEPCKNTASCSYSANFRVDPALIEKAVGFADVKLGPGSSYNVTIPDDRKMEIRTYTNYQKKSFDIGSNKGGLLDRKGSGTAKRPVGLIFEQILKEKT